MSKYKVLPSLALSFTLLLSGCGAFSGTNPPATGAVLGTAAGAGAGALVGTLLSRGDVAASALLGAGIGLPVGLALGYAWQRQSEQAEEAARIEQYIRNQETIRYREEEIEALRREVLKDGPSGLPDGDSQHLFGGPSLGNPFR